MSISRKTSQRFTAMLIATLMLLPALAFATPPFNMSASSLSADIITIITPIAGLAVLVVGCICWFGTMSWAWFGALIAGIGLVFGHDQVVAWIRGLLGV